MRIRTAIALGSIVVVHNQIIENYVELKKARSRSPKMPQFA